MRNFIYLHAIEQGIDIPIGTQDAALLDTRYFDDEESQSALEWQEAEQDTVNSAPSAMELNEAALRAQAVVAYRAYRTLGGARFKWLSPRFFKKELASELEADARELLRLLNLAGIWIAATDAKLNALADLIQKQHNAEKLLIFTQFADTARYLEVELSRRGIKALQAVTGDTTNPTLATLRFSPVSNEARKEIAKSEELRVLIATDVLSEGQNLQDAAIVVNYDLPWAIIRLIQRAGRIDRIGQQADAIACYTFMPADGVERIIRLRARVRDRLHQNAEVIGTDEAFFEDDHDDQMLKDRYNEKSGVLDDPEDGEVDLSSYAWQVWNNATKDDEALKSEIENLPNVVFSAKARAADDGVLVYLRTAEDNDALAWLSGAGKIVTESQLDILRAAACVPTEPALERAAQHHDLVRQAVETLVEQERTTGGNLGRPSGPRARAYERLKRLADERKKAFSPISNSNLRSTTSTTIR